MNFCNYNEDVDHYYNWAVFDYAVDDFHVVVIILDVGWYSKLGKKSIIINFPSSLLAIDYLMKIVHTIVDLGDVVDTDVVNDMVIAENIPSRVATMAEAGSTEIMATKLLENITKGIEDRTQHVPVVIMD